MKPTAIALLLISALPLQGQSKWFEHSTEITRMHEKLLDDDLSGMFELMVQVWQQDLTGYMQPHLNALLKQSLEKDCGKSLETQNLPTWLSAVTIKKMSVQLSGRHSNKLVVSLSSEDTIDSINLVRWPEASLSSEVQFDNSNETLVEEQQILHETEVTYHLSGELESGLYQLDLVDVKKRRWRTWLLFGRSDPVHVVRWDSRDTWAVDKKKLLNTDCPLPKLEVDVFDYVEGKYEQVWEKSYEAQYPVKLPTQLFPADRYVVTLSMTNSRWQGPILYQDEHTISKTIDLTEE